MKVNCFTLRTNLIPALLSEGISFRFEDCNTTKIMVSHKDVDICRVEAIPELCTDYCYKVSWAHLEDTIRFYSNYKHFTTLINDIKKAIKCLENGRESKMNKKMYRVSNVEFKSSPSQMDEMTFTVNVLNSNCAVREDCDRIRKAIESIDETLKIPVYRNETEISGTPYLYVGRGNGKTQFIKSLYYNSIRFDIKDVIFNDPATIVLWADGTKTVVKAENEPFDPEKGLAMAISKRALGGKYNYYDTFKKYVGRYEKKQRKG